MAAIGVAASALNAYNVYKGPGESPIVDAKYFLIRRPCVVRPKRVTLAKSEDVLKATRAVLRSSKAFA